MLLKIKFILVEIIFLSILTANGQNWTPLISGVDAGGVDALYADTSSGLLYVGGYFQNASGTSANFIASWNGTSWAPVGTGMNSTVYCLVKYNGELYAGGTFNFAGGLPIAYLAKWDGIAWSPVSTLITSPITHLTVHNGELFMVSSNTQIFRWDGTTLNYSSFGSNGQIWTIESYGNYLVVGGTFTTVNGNTVNYITKWDGVNWSAIGNGFNAYVGSVESYNGNLYAGGEFTYSGGTPIKSIAKWNGTAWLPLGSGVTCGVGNYSNVLKILGYNNEIYVCGIFCTAGGILANSIAKYNGSTWSVFNSGLNNGGVTLAIYLNDLYEGGGSSHAGGVLVNYIAKWDLSTSFFDSESYSFALPKPNPFNEICIIHTNIEDLGNYRFKLVNVLGNELNIDYSISGTDIYLQRSGVTNGIYSFQIFSQDKLKSSSKIVAY